MPGFGRDPLYGSIREETTNMSLAARSDVPLVQAARNRGHNTDIGKGIWSLHAKVTFIYNILSSQLFSCNLSILAACSLLPCL